MHHFFSFFYLFKIFLIYLLHSCKIVLFFFCLQLLVLLAFFVLALSFYSYSDNGWKLSWFFSAVVVSAHSFMGGGGWLWHKDLQGLGVYQIDFRYNRKEYFRVEWTELLRPSRMVTPTIRGWPGRVYFWTAPRSLCW